jgi:hypothetical protein
MAQAYNVLPPAQNLWELFDYKPLTGEFIWKNSTGAAARNSVAGSLQNKGYCSVRINNGRYLAHRLVWCWVTGTDPADYEVDHIDGNRLNNAWKNLRLATCSQNRCNSKTRKHNCTGIKGAKITPTGKYQARIVKDKVYHYLGTFDTAEQAGAAYAVAAAKLHGEFARVC